MTLLFIVLITSASCGGVPLEGGEIGILEQRIGFTPERAAALRRQRYDLTRGCMNAAGFSWTAPGADPYLAASPHGLFGLETPDAVRAYRLTLGYGIAGQVPLIQAESEEFNAPDPQAEYLATLGADELSRYRRTLLGSGAEPGCWGSAVDRTGGVGALGNFQPLTEAMAEALEAFRRDPRVRAIERSVLACVNEEGVIASSIAEVRTDLQARLIEMVGGESSVDESGRLHFAWGAIDGTGAEQVIKIPTAELNALRDEEMRIAAIEVGCRDRFREGLAEAMTEHSQPVIDRFTAEIDEIAAAFSTIATEEGT